MFRVVARRQAGQRVRTCLAWPSARLVFISRPTGSFTQWVAAASDAAGSDFTHPFEYDPATNSLDHQVGDLSRHRSEQHGLRCACRFWDAIHLLRRRFGSGRDGATDRVFRYDPVTDAISSGCCSLAW